MKKILYIVTLSLLVTLISSIQLQIVAPQTCLDYLVDQADSRKMFYFHYNHNVDSINMVLYHKNSKRPWHETGYGIDYKTSLQVQYQQAGNYTFCIHKKSEGFAHVSFQIVNQQHMSQYVGKQQLAKLSRRISQFLMDIKRVGFTFKNVLEQHNWRKQTIQQQQNNYGLLLILKTAAMLIIVAIQVVVIKKIFK